MVKKDGESLALDETTRIKTGQPVTISIKVDKLGRRRKNSRNLQQCLQRKRQALWQDVGKAGPVILEEAGQAKRPDFFHQEQLYRVALVPILSSLEPKHYLDP